MMRISSSAMIRLAQITLGSVFLVSCFTPVPPVPSGAKVRVINTIPSLVTVRHHKLGLIGSPKEEVTESAIGEMMRRVASHEATRAGLKLTYVEHPLPVPASLFQMGDNSLPNLPRSLLPSSPDEIVIVAAPAGNLNKFSDGCSTYGFAIDGALIRGGIVAWRYDRPLAPKIRQTGSSAAGMDQLVLLKDGGGDTLWRTDLPINRQAALKIWEIYFRTAFVKVLGNRSSTR